MTTQNQPLQAGELTEWIALRRVCAGGVALLGSRYQGACPGAHGST